MLRKIKARIENSLTQRILAETMVNRILLGKLLSETNKSKSTIKDLANVEFKVFSQFGDDGIIDWLVHTLDLQNQTFIEFGVENYRESNTRFLLRNRNWKGLVLDGSRENVDEIQSMPESWQHQLTSVHAFIDCENVNSLIESNGMTGDVGLLHIDIDGNDYWIWQAITVVSPAIAIIEYNGALPSDRAITIPYRKDFQRSKAHFSNIYYGTTLLALLHLGRSLGYRFIGSNSAGNNAYFVRNDLATSSLPQPQGELHAVCPQFAESRDANGLLTKMRGAECVALLKGLPVINVTTGETETI